MKKIFLFLLSTLVIIYFISINDNSGKNCTAQISLVAQAFAATCGGDGQACCTTGNACTSPNTCSQQTGKCCVPDNGVCSKSNIGNGTVCCNFQSDQGTPTECVADSSSSTGARCKVQPAACVKDGGACTGGTSPGGQPLQGDCCTGDVCNNGTCTKPSTACVNVGGTCAKTGTGDKLGNCCDNSSHSIECFAADGLGGTCLDDNSNVCMASGATGCELPGGTNPDPRKKCCGGLQCFTKSSKPNDTVCIGNCADENSFCSTDPNNQNGLKNCCAKNSAGKPLTCAAAKIGDQPTCMAGVAGIPGIPNYPQYNTCAGGTCNTAIGSINTNTPASIVLLLFRIVLSLSGIIAVLLIIYSGYRLMTARNNPQAIDGAKETLISAIVGLLFVIFAVVIFTTIGVDILQVPGIGK